MQVGTVFVHLSANIMSALYRGVQVQIADNGVNVPLGFLQGGQSRDAIVPCPSSTFEITVTTENSSEIFSLAVPAGSPEVASSFEVPRQLFIKALADALAKGDFAPLASAYDAIKAFGDDERITAILTDMKHADADKGQIGKALESDNFKRWGRHYLPGVLSVCTKTMYPR